MANVHKTTTTNAPSKKEIKKELAGKIENAILEMKDALGEKKFHRRIRKAAKLLMQGIHSNGVLKKAKKNADGKRAESIRKAAAKKTKAGNAKKVKAALPEIFTK